MGDANVESWNERGSRQFGLWNADEKGPGRDGHCGLERTNERLALRTRKDQGEMGTADKKGPRRDWHCGLERTNERLAQRTRKDQREIGTADKKGPTRDWHCGQERTNERPTGPLVLWRSIQEGFRWNTQKWNHGMKEDRDSLVFGTADEKGPTRD